MSAWASATSTRGNVRSTQARQPSRGEDSGSMRCDELLDQRDLLLQRTGTQDAARQSSLAALISQARSISQRDPPSRPMTTIRPRSAQHSRVERPGRGSDQVEHQVHALAVRCACRIRSATSRAAGIEDDGPDSHAGQPSRFSAVRHRPITVAPPARASWSAAVPTPEAAAWTSKTSPGARASAAKRARRTR